MMIIPFTAMYLHLISSFTKLDWGEELSTEN